MNDTKTTAFIAGHRPPQLWNGYPPFRKELDGYDKHMEHIKLLSKIIKIYIDNGINTFIIGGTLGFDLMCADIILKMKEYTNVSLIVAKPFSKHGKQWPSKMEDYFKDVCEQADSTINVSMGGYTPTKMMFRNQWMIDNADYGLIMWDEEHVGEIFSCMKYSKKCDKNIIVINPDTLQLSTLV